MANRQLGYGISGEIQMKRKCIYDDSIDQEQEARVWIESILNIELKPGSDPNTPLGAKEFGLALKSGEVLCRLMNVLSPNSTKVNIIGTNRNTAFKAMENISMFLDAAEKYGVKKTDLFQTADLYDNVNMLAVRNAIYALGRRARNLNFEGPVLGPKEAEQNKRDFDESVLKAGSTVIGLQMGAHKGASQRGMSFGKTRSIMD